MKSAFSTIATILGNPVYWESPYRAHTSEQMATLRQLGFNTIFVNLAWSRPWMDVVTLEQLHVGTSYPWLSDTNALAAAQATVRQRLDGVVAAGLRPFFLFGCPAQIDLTALTAEQLTLTELLCGVRTSRIAPRVSIACIRSPQLRQHYRELLHSHFARFPETAGLLIYTVDELAEVCDELDDCPRCQNLPLHERLPEFLAFLRQVIDEINPSIELWWEPWEFTTAQTYAVVGRLDPRIKLSVHTGIHEVYYVNRPDLWLRHLCRLAADRGIEVIVEGFFSGTGEDLGPLPAYPCPRLVYEQLRSISELPSVVGIKEYFGTVAEHLSVNDRALQGYLQQPNASDTTIIGEVAQRFGDTASAPLLQAWEAASRAVESFPWDLSWRLRHYNSVRYDQGFGGQGVGGQYWARDFVASLPTPWTTPSWESSRYAAYIVAANACAVGVRLLLETDQRLQQTLSHVDTALHHLAALPMLSEDNALRQDLQRQIDSLVLFRHLTLARSYHLQASQLAATLRGDPSPAVTDDSPDKLAECLRADLANAEALYALVNQRGYRGFDLPPFAHTIQQMHAEIAAYQHDPLQWVRIHFVPAGQIPL